MIATTIEQSKHLIELGIPKESADMWYPQYVNGATGELCDSEKLELYKTHKGTPAWSLSALLEQIPSDLGSQTLTIEKCDSEPLKYGLNYHDSWGRENDIQTKYYDNLVDACYEMIIKLHEQKLL